MTIIASAETADRAAALPGDESVFIIRGSTATAQRSHTVPAGTVMSIGEFVQQRGGGPHKPSFGRGWLARIAMWLQR